MNFFHKNKPLLFVAFLATVVVVFYRLNYGGYAGSVVIPQQKQTATISDSSLLLKKQQFATSTSETEIFAFEQSNTAKNQNSPEKLVSVIRVIDGDTIVANINGLPVHVRLIGINSPELNDKRAQVSCLARKAKEEAEKLLDKQNIYLEKDSTQGDYDKYSRLLAYVFLQGSINFNKLMIEEGYAYEYTYRLPYKYQSEFKAAQNEARTAQKGLWNSNTCRN